MNPEIFQVLKSTSAVTTILGANPLRFYRWGEVPAGTKPPYGTYGVYNGIPENQLDKVPDIDNMGTQIDLWGATAAASDQAAIAVRDALEGMGHMTGFDNASRDPETKLFHSRMEFDFWTAR